MKTLAGIAILGGLVYGAILIGPLWTIACLAALILAVLLFNGE